MKRDGVTEIGTCRIHSSAEIMPGSIIGKKFRRLLTGAFDKKDYVTSIGKNAYIGYSCLVGNGSKIGIGSILDDKCVIESQVKIGKKTLLIYNAQLCNEVKIGNDCVIGGLIGERTIVGNNCRIFGKIVHTQLHPLNPWDEDKSEEDAVRIYDKVFIGFNSVVAGKINIGPQAYVLSGSLITKDVPAFHIAFGRNEMIRFSKWKGKLKNSNLFK